MQYSRLSFLAIAATGLTFANAAHADVSVPYTLVGTFALPSNTYDLLPDGRLISIDPAGNVAIQNAVNSSAYTNVGSIGTINSDGFGPAFVSVSPDGSTLAVGNNEFNTSNAVLFYDTVQATSGSATPTHSITTPHFAGDWSDNQTFYVSGADAATFGTVVNRLDLTLGASTTVISPAGGFSGAVHTTGGTLYAGEGDTGNVFAFDLPTLASATTSAPISSGTLTTTHESAGSIDTDLFGNLIVAGGFFDFGSGTFTGSAAVIDPATQDKLVLTPAGLGTFYGAYFNDATNELVVTADGTAYVYAIPTPGVLAPMTLGLVALRRRNRN
ncbi:MAG: hypothetical protein KDA31_10845 [Phycisphaerales bacterium]|nr:hypothetical protein [Phycisphaerales bacterium]MCB9835342.1 hypothetical protein [Phycisphaera sp.]